MSASSKSSPPCWSFSSLAVFFSPSLLSRTMLELPALSFTRDLERRGAAAGMFGEGYNWRRAAVEGWFPLAVLVSDGRFLRPR